MGSTHAIILYKEPPTPSADRSTHSQTRRAVQENHGTVVDDNSGTDGRRHGANLKSWKRSADGAGWAVHIFDTPRLLHPVAAICLTSPDGRRIVNRRGLAALTSSASSAHG